MEDVIGYNRPMLTKGILSEIDALNFFIKPYEWYGENNIKLTLKTKVTEIDSKAKTLTLSNGETRTYDKLILATGADAFVPPVKGADLAGVYSIRTLTDVNSLQSDLDAASKAVVIGGGVLGLEAAWEFCKAGKEVTVLENSSGVMFRQLDSKASALLKEASEKAGVRIITDAKVEEIVGTDKVTGVRLADGTMVEGQIVILSTGVRQNIELAQAIGAETGRSILVNEKMETSVADIYACGDCAEFKGANYAIWNQAIDMGKVAGANAVGDSLTYEQIIPANAFHGMGTSLFAVGDNGKDPDKKYKSFEIFDDAKHTYEKLYFVNNRFCGGILLGDVVKSAKLLEGYKNQDPINKLM